VYPLNGNQPMISNSLKLSALLAQHATHMKTRTQQQIFELDGLPHLALGG